MSLSAYIAQAARRLAGVKSTACVLPTASWSSLADNRLWSAAHVPPQHQQVRWRSAKKRRHTTQPFWQAQVTRTMYPEGITPENEEFVEEAIKSMYAAEVEESPLERAPWSRGEWAPKSQRCGLVGKKLGSMVLWSKQGDKCLTTMIHISDNHVIRYVPAQEAQKNAWNHFVRISKRPRGLLIVGADSADPRLFTKEYYNMFEEAGVMPKKKLTKFVVSDNAILQPGTPLYATHFRPGDFVDIAGFTMDRGYQGVVKRWNFRGGPAGHGCTKFHNKGGYIGCGGARAIVMPGKKMPGHMGMEFVTQRGSRILRINAQFNVIWVHGKIPGAINDYVNIYDSGLFHLRYRDPENHPPFPTHYPGEQPVEHVDWYADDVHNFRDKSIIFEDEVAA